MVCTRVQKALEQSASDTNDVKNLGALEIRDLRCGIERGCKRSGPVSDAELCRRMFTCACLTSACLISQRCEFHRSLCMCLCICAMAWFQHNVLARFGVLCGTESTPQCCPVYVFAWLGDTRPYQSCAVLVCVCSWSAAYFSCGMAQQP
jgi:hypothetical protein